MKVILSTTPPSGGSLVSRFPNNQETGPFMNNLFRLLEAVEKLYPYQMHCSVWFLAGQEDKVTANLEIELLGSAQMSYCARIASGLDGSFPISLATVSTGLSSIEITEGEFQTRAETIVAELKKKEARKKQ